MSKAHSVIIYICLCHPSVAQSRPTLQPHGLQHARQVSLSFTISRSLLKVMSIESVMPSNPLILCHPLLFPPSIFRSIRVLSNELALCIRWPKDWSFSFSWMSIQGWFPLGLTGLISLLSRELSRVFSSTPIQKHQFFGAQLLYGPTLTWPMEKPQLWLRGPLSPKWYLCFLIPV